MDKHTAAEIVEAIRSSIQNEPTQFNIVVNVTGQQITASGGTGLEEIGGNRGTPHLFPFNSENTTSETR
jgi:hypothetical protein